MFKRLFSHYIAEEARPMLQLALPLVHRRTRLDDDGHRGHDDGGPSDR